MNVKFWLMARSMHSFQLGWSNRPDGIHPSIHGMGFSQYSNVKHDNSSQLINNFFKYFYNSNFLGVFNISEKTNDFFFFKLSEESILQRMDVKIICFALLKDILLLLLLVFMWQLLDKLWSHHTVGESEFGKTMRKYSSISILRIPLTRTPGC